jgi:hypothetical protein
MSAKLFSMIKYISNTIKKRALLYFSLDWNNIIVGIVSTHQLRGNIT